VPAVAVKVALEEPVAVKVALEEPNGIVTLEGTDRASTLELSPATTGLPVAEALRLTVHVVVPPEDREVGAHPMEDRVKAGVTKMLPPVAETVIGYPATDAARVPLTPMDMEPAVGASVTVTTATMPFGIAFVLSPLVRQIYELAPPAQLKVFPAEVNTDPGITEKLVTLAEG
jgi:hypothetical protein